MPVLTGIDVIGVQRYVFASNRLRDAVGASQLVRWATSTGSGGAPAELGVYVALLAAGGNAIVEFGDQAEARRFAARYSRLLWERAPGLEVALAHREVQPDGLRQALQELHIELERLKTERVPSVPLLGLGVTASCRETGLAATGFADGAQTEPLSAQVLRLRDAGVLAHANRRWQTALAPLPSLGDQALDLPLDLDHMGRSRGDVSLMAVVHIDGNGVGQKIQEWLAAQPDAAAIRAGYQQWSPALDRLAEGVMQSLIERLGASIALRPRRDGEKPEPWLVGTVDELSFALATTEHRVYLPIRPVLVGGDDLTFVCDGRVALDLVGAALAAFEQTAVPPLGAISACAGVAICRTHTPFARAYELADSLCQNAKRLRRDHGIEGSVLDWHVGTPRPGEAIGDIRERQYRANADGRVLRLTARPYALGASAEEALSWRWLAGVLLGAGAGGLRGDYWRGRRGKALELARTARRGPAVVGETLRTWQIVEPALTLPQAVPDGFRADATPLLDAAELLDLYLPLSTREATHG